jgi:hypothetical protein
MNATKFLCGELLLSDNLTTLNSDVLRAFMNLKYIILPTALQEVSTNFLPTMNSIDRIVFNGDLPTIPGNYLMPNIHKISIYNSTS